MFSLEILERYAKPNLSPELQEQMDQLSNGVRNAKRMIDNLVTFATYLSKQGELHVSEINFKLLLKESLPSLQSMATAKNISLDLHLPPTLPQLQGDADRLSDAIYHLVQNAIKFTQPSGKVWLQCESTPTSLRFEVQDTGIGIPANRLPDLWEGFTQMADPLQRGAEGLGLGLALVKYVITAHNGEVWAQSEAGVGSKFGFEIPHQGPQPTPPAAITTEAQPARKTGTGPLVPAKAI
jgi:signal transduction histidine kinase